MDILNFEYHNVSLEVAEILLSTVSEFHSKELFFEYTLLHTSLKVHIFFFFFFLFAINAFLFV